MRIALYRTPEARRYQAFNAYGEWVWHSYGPTWRDWRYWIRHDLIPGIRTYIPRLLAAHVGRKVLRARLAAEALQAASE